jgi:hypothetical protein
MHASSKLLAVGTLAVFAAFGSMSASAQSDGNDFHPLVRTSGAKPEVDAGAVAAAHPDNGEPVGSSTSPAMTHSTITREQVYQEAVAAAHPSGTEPIGSSTSAPMVKSAGTGE